MAEGTWSVQPGGELTVVFHIFVKGRAGAGTDLLALMTSERTQGNGLNLCQSLLRMDIGKKFFTIRVVGRWKKLPKEVVTALSLTEFKKSLDLV